MLFVDGVDAVEAAKFIGFAVAFVLVACKVYDFLAAVLSSTQHIANITNRKRRIAILC